MNKKWAGVATRGFFEENHLARGITHDLVICPERILRENSPRNNDDVFASGAKKAVIRWWGEIYRQIGVPRTQILISIRRRKLQFPTGQFSGHFAEQLFCSTPVDTFYPFWAVSMAVSRFILDTAGERQALFIFGSNLLIS